MCFTAQGPNLHPSIIKQAWRAACTHKRSHVCNQTCNCASSVHNAHTHTHEGWVGDILVLICGSAPLTYIALSAQQSNSVPQSGCSIVWLTLRSFLTATICWLRPRICSKTSSCPPQHLPNTIIDTRMLPLWSDAEQDRFFFFFFMSVPAQSLREFL